MAVLDGALADIVAVAASVLAGVAGRHGAVARGAADQSLEQGGGSGADVVAPPPGILGQDRMHLVPDGGVDDGLVLPGIGLALVHRFAEVDAVV